MEGRSCRQEADNGYPPSVAAEYVVRRSIHVFRTMMLLPSRREYTGISASRYSKN